METAKNIIFLLTLAVLVISPVQSEETQAAQISNTRTANCLVKVTCDPAILPMNLETLDYLLHSSGVGGKARREVLDISPDQDYDLFTIDYVHLNTSEDISALKPSTGLLSGTDEYEYAPMMERGGPSAGSSRRDSSSSRGSTTASRGSTTASRYESVPDVSSGRRSRDRGDFLYGYYSASGTPRQRSANASASPADEQTFLFRLNVDLPEDIKPLAREFINALVDNLRESLREAHFEYSHNLEALLKDAESRRDRVRSRLAKVMEQVKAVGPPPAIEQNPADAAVYEQLEQIVDLSMLAAQMSFDEVITLLEQSVDPPLQIQPNWKDLLENAEIEQTTPAGVDPLSNIKLRKALEILIAAVSDEFAELDYVVDEGVILIATRDRLPSKLVTRIYDISDFAYSAGSAKEVANAIQKTIEPESWYESDMGEGTITPYPSQQPRKLAVLQTSEIHQKIQKFLESIRMNIPAGIPLEIPAEVHLRKQNNLLAEKENLEMELARLQSRMPAVEEQIKRIKKEIDLKVHTDQVSEELRNIIVMQEKYLEEYKRLVENDTVSSGGLAEKLARARIELARRSEQIGASAGTAQLSKFSNELAMLAIDIAENKAMLKIVSNQLNRTEQQLTASTILDPQASQMRFAVRAFEIAELTS